MEPLEQRMLLSAGYPGHVYDVGQTPVAIATADFNGDQRIDSAVANFDDDTVSLLFGDPDGTFQAAQNLNTGDGPKSIGPCFFEGRSMDSNRGWASERGRTLRIQFRTRLPVPRPPILAGPS